MVQGQVFVATQVGDKGSPERQRADEVTDYVVAPVAEERGLAVTRADRDPTPGQITPQILSSLLESDAVIADISSRNANVYYEIGVAHSFGKPVILLANSAEDVVFDTKDERVTELGSAGGELGVVKAEEAKKQLREALDTVLDPSHRVTSTVSQVATVRSVEELSDSDPEFRQLEEIREAVEEIRSTVRPQRVVPDSVREEMDSLRHFVEMVAGRCGTTIHELDELITGQSREKFDTWVRELEQQVERECGPSAPPEPDDVPF